MDAYQTENISRPSPLAELVQSKKTIILAGVLSALALPFLIMFLLGLVNIKNVWDFLYAAFEGINSNAALATILAIIAMIVAIAFIAIQIALAAGAVTACLNANPKAVKALYVIEAIRKVMYTIIVIALAALAFVLTIMSLIGGTPFYYLIMLIAILLACLAYMYLLPKFHKNAANVLRESSACLENNTNRIFCEISMMRKLSFILSVAKIALALIAIAGTIVHRADIFEYVKFTEFAELFKLTPHVIVIVAIVVIAISASAYYLISKLTEELMAINEQI